VNQPLTVLHSKLTDMQQPAHLDENSTFRISEPFQVSERLDCVAYHMALGAPYWVKSTQAPKASKSKSTAKFVNVDNEISIKRLHTPPMDTIREILDIEIDLTSGSPLNKVLEVNHSSIFRHRRSTMVVNHISQRTHLPFPELNENDYAQIVEGSLKNVVPLVVFLILQLWICDKVDPDSQEFRNAIAILMCLDSSSVIRDEECIPDLAIGGPAIPKLTTDIMSHGTLFALSTLDRKSKEFAEYFYSDVEHADPAFSAKTKDGLLDDIIENGGTIHDICQIFKNKKAESYTQRFKGGWRTDTLHLLGQVIFSIHFHPIF
jgi:hypothetical protein